MSKKNTTEVTKKNVEKWHAVPIKGSFMVFSMIGFLVSAYLITNVAWRLAFMSVFTIMFVASLVSLAKSPIHA